MTDPEPDPVDRAARSLSPVPPMPASLPERLCTAVAAERARLFRRKKMMRRLSLVAVLVVAGSTAVAFWPSTSAAQAVAAAVKKMGEAKGIKAVIRKTRQGQPDEVSTTWAYGDKVREEVIDKPGFVTLSDTELGLVVSVDPAQKTVERSLRDPTQPHSEARLSSLRKMFAKPLDLVSLVNFTPEYFKLDRDESIDGRAVKVYSTRRKGVSTEVKIFIDRETGLLRRIVDQSPGIDSVEDYAYFDTPPDPKLFELTIPAGYKLTEPAKPGPKADEHYTGAMQRLCTLNPVRVVAQWDYNPGPNSITAPRLVTHTVTLSGAITRIDQQSLPGVPGLTRDGETYEKTHLCDGSGPVLRYITLNHVTKTASDDGDAGLIYHDLARYFDLLVHAPGRRVGLDRIDGAVCDVYRVIAEEVRGNYRMAGTDTLVWVARATQLPVRIAVNNNNHLETFLSEFDYSPKVDPKLFDLLSPSGYRILKTDNSVEQFIPSPIR